ncbi:MAG: hypothetical protein KGJ32_03005 [Xanthomonadaceae bacterium]|nr:hypothetical protein [Xanthomonadaceae bacterium]
MHNYTVTGKKTAWTKLDPEEWERLEKSHLDHAGLLEEYMRLWVLHRKLRQIIDEGSEKSVKIGEGLMRKEAGHKKGGAKAAKANKDKAAKWHAKAIKRARKLIEGNHGPHNITGIVARHVNKSTDVVRPVLQAVGIVPRRKSRTR